VESDGPVTTELDVRLRPGGVLLLTLEESGRSEGIGGAIPDLEDARTGADWLDLVRRGALGGEAGSTADWRRASDLLLFEHAGDGRYRVGPVEPGPYELRVEHPLYRTERRRLTILPPGDGLVGVGAEGADRPGTITLLVEMSPVR
jgi:hypothetical protein